MRKGEIKKESERKKEREKRYDKERDRERDRSGIGKREKWGMRKRERVLFT
jgi:hypothetical protein